VFNGVSASGNIKSYAMSYAVELDLLFRKIDTPVLYLLFHGAVVRRQKLQKGEIITVSD